MNTLSPKLQFQTVHKTEAENLNRSIRSERTIGVSCLYAMCEMVKMGASREELDGAEKFIDILMNIASPSKPATQLPSKELRDLSDIQKFIDEEKSKKEK